MDKFCTHCGAEIVPGDKFCRACGAAIHAEKVPAPRRKIRWRSPLAIISILLLIIVVYLLFVYPSSPRFALQQTSVDLMERDYQGFYSHLEPESIIGNMAKDLFVDVKRGTIMELIPKDPQWANVRTVLKALTKVINLGEFIYIIDKMEGGSLNKTIQESYNDIRILYNLLHTVYPNDFPTSEELESMIGTLLKTELNKKLDTITTEQFFAILATVTMAKIDQRGDEALVAIPLSQEYGDLRLTMARSSQDNDWRVVSINYDDLKRLILQANVAESENKLSSYHKFNFSNKSIYPMRLAIHYKKVDGSWNTIGWWEIDPDSPTWLVLSDNSYVTTNNNIFYYYAETKDGSLYWGGDDEFSLNGRMLPMIKQEIKETDEYWELPNPYHPANVRRDD